MSITLHTSFYLILDEGSALLSSFPDEELRTERWNDKPKVRESKWQICDETKELDVTASALNKLHDFGQVNGHLNTSVSSPVKWMEEQLLP